MNNKKTLKKILEKLSEPTPDLSYVKGMLEVLIDEDEPVRKPQNRDEEAVVIFSNGFESSTVDIPREFAVPNSHLEEIKRLSEESSG